MDSNRWSSLCRMAARSTLSSRLSNHRLLCNFGAAISDDFCTIVPSEASNNNNNFCTNHHHQQQKQHEFKCKAMSFLPPVLMLPSSEVYEEEENYYDYEGFLCLKNRRIMRLLTPLSLRHMDADCTGSSKGWLAFVSRRDFRMTLFDFLTSSASARTVPLPSIQRLCSPASSSSSSSSHRHLIKKVAVTASPSKMKLADFVVMMSLGDGRGLAFSRIGDPDWTMLPGSTEVDDVFYSIKYKLFYSFVSSIKGKLQAWDFNEADGNGFPKRIVFDFDVPYRGWGLVCPDFLYERVMSYCYSVEHYLVELPGGDILHLARYSVPIGEDGSSVKAPGFPRKLNLPLRTVLFAAFKLDFENQIEVPVESLGDTSLFVGFNESFSLSTRDHPDLMANAIYFSDDKAAYIYRDSYPYGGDDMGVYNFEDHSITPLYDPVPVQFKKIQPPPIWVSRAKVNLWLSRAKVNIGASVAPIF